MKRGTFIFLAIFLLSIVSAIPSIEFQNSDVSAGETILATLTTTGQFIKQIDSSDITFYESRKQTPFESDITFYNGTHYLYIYTTRPGNFSFKISNILYKEADELKSTTLEEPLEILETQNQTLSIKPGFIFTTSTPKIKLINKGTEVLTLTYDKTELSIQPLASEEIILTPKQTFSFLKISSYKDFSIPIIYPVNENTTFISPLKKIDLRHDPPLLFAEITINSEEKQTISLFNFGEENITNIRTTSELSFIEIEDIQDIQPREVRNITITFNPKNPGHFQSYINITFNQSEETGTLSIPLSLFILPKGSTPEDFQISEETCEEISGESCTDEQTCIGDATFTKKGEYCCLGKCELTEEESKTSYGWVWAILIFAALGYSGYYFYKKQKNLKPGKPEDKLKEASDKFNKRLQGDQTKRITGGLSKS
ncbi:MAG: DUF1573 domain-containing protein [Nanoarchaeota archaeon]|nr:DUF1573 domain-containing protein [Nanoarchaeota archaeon]